MEESTTEHEIYISLGLKNYMKPSDCTKLIAALIIENFTLESWGVNTKDDMNGIIEDQQIALKQKDKEINLLKSSTFPLMASILHDEQKKVILEKDSQISLLKSALKEIAEYQRDQYENGLHAYDNCKRTAIEGLRHYEDLLDLALAPSLGRTYPA